MFELVMPLKTLDSVNLKLTLEYIVRFINPKRIVIITNHQNFNPTLSKSFGNKITFLDEDKLIEGLNLQSIQNKINTRNKAYIKRAGWYLQQFLKMGYARAKIASGGGGISHLGRRYYPFKRTSIF
ncbi:hypothetical protein [Helicobacter himalayensis]|uniref:hypothetical protein n=1 Tax=Helicobacter himalayensis TaxID=1591088 RepID=UPI00082FDEB6|nr:hypothetical protein [Helicobacter himalayensis]